MRRASLSALLTIYCLSAETAPQVEYLSDLFLQDRLQHVQGWGILGADAAARSTGPKRPLRIKEKEYERGLGHHANGTITVPLYGAYHSFHATIGVHWQGGGKGSVTFTVLVDGEKRFEAGPLNDSSPAQEIEIDLTGAQELLLKANDSGDGIGCDMANWAEARLDRDVSVPLFGKTNLSFEPDSEVLESLPMCGFTFVACREGSQVAIEGDEGAFVVSLDKERIVRVRVPLRGGEGEMKLSARAAQMGEGPVEVSLSAPGSPGQPTRLEQGEEVTLERSFSATQEEQDLLFLSQGLGHDAGVRWSELSLSFQGIRIPIPLSLASPAETILPSPELPRLRPLIEQAFIEWDWRAQDGIYGPRKTISWREATETLIQRCEAMLADLERRGSSSDLGPWTQCVTRFKRLASHSSTPSPNEWKTLWREAHALRRKIMLDQFLRPLGPVAFVKQVPGSFSHQLTQYYGRCSRPGGGIYALDDPADSMSCRSLTGSDFPQGSFQHLDISYDGSVLLFAFCEIPDPIEDWRTAENVFHLYEYDLKTSTCCKLAEGPYDDFCPRYLPNGNIVFLSTRRGGFHRCGRGPCPTYTLTTCKRDGSEIQVISVHETHEWDPAVLQDGRIIYTRWDYVDRSAVYYQQLWTVRQDGSNVRAFYGNNTLNPLGIWEARPIPDSDKAMATAAAHHAMTAGSIITIDPREEIDGPSPLTRLTRDVPFPESELPVQHWHNTAGLDTAPKIPAEALRWPGHCYRSPYPLSEFVFLAAYSFMPLIGEPNANAPNMFGLYIVDCHGNKELIHRDLNISSLWPIPLKTRPKPPRIPAAHAMRGQENGLFFLQNVYRSCPALPDEKITHLRIVQVLPKSTPNANDPKVGAANASPGRQVLGTVPVEADGSAYFKAPARIPLCFQALDREGMAVQTMRSIVYLQPGETTSCVGCHEPRTMAPEPASQRLAMARDPSIIEPGPEGSRPFSYPRLIQPLLDEKCIRCHQGNKPKGGVLLTGDPQGEFSVSYNTLSPRVKHAAWTGGDFKQTNSEPLTQPDFFGARASRLTSILKEKHEEVTLTRADWESLITWMDANALFYGTFDRKDQERQKNGALIEGPAVQ